MPYRFQFIRGALAAALAGGILALIGACDGQVPKRVWVPGPGYSVVLEVSFRRGSSARVAAGQWVHLRARRQSGPWVQVSSKTLDREATWMRRPPPPMEEDVQANVHWLVEPEGHAEFDLPTSDDVRVRRVRFKSPGSYTVWARTHDWAGGEVESSNRLTLEVADAN